jgi:hypothetical protein
VGTARVAAAGVSAPCICAAARRRAPAQRPPARREHAAHEPHEAMLSDAALQLRQHVCLGSDLHGAAGVCVDAARRVAPAKAALPPAARADRVSRQSARSPHSLGARAACRQAVLARARV